MGALRHAYQRTELAGLALGGGLTIAIAFAMVDGNARLSLGVTVGVLAYVLLVTAWRLLPQVMVAITIPLFAFLPAAKVLVSPVLGPAKDFITLAAGGAVLSTLLQRGKRPSEPDVDRPLVWLVLAVVGLYVVNVGGGLAGGGHGIAWAQGLRLVSEPLILLVAGLTVRNPGRMLDVAAASLVGTGVVVAAYGLYQQHAGPAGLVSMGYSYTAQVRTISGHLRSFGTLDDPFTYAAFLFLSLSAVLFWMRRGLIAFACGSVIVFGIAVSFVRTAAVISVALIAVWLARRRRTVLALILLGVTACAASTLLFAQAGASETRSVQVGPSTYVTLNGRTTVWKTIFRDPTQLPFGIGVGQVGTAAQRATLSIVRTGQASDNRNSHHAVDSAYFATVADIGLIGLGVLLALLTRLVVLARAGTRAPGSAGWLALAILSTLLIDAITRESFNGFPTAYIGLLVVGIALASARQSMTLRSSGR